MIAASVTAVVPTVGRSPLLLECLAALRQEGGAALRIVLVEQGEAPLELPAALAVDRLHTVDRLGFARAANLGIDAASTPLVALVNDDAVPRPPWLAPLQEALDRDPAAASAQGVNLASLDPPRLDGCGLGWNERWQAVQILHGRPASDAPIAPREVFGVSATAALYRRAALHDVAGPEGAFDPRLGSYYEDVDLACRLRAAGHRALLVPGAVCRHVGSSSVSEGERLALVYRNRYLVLARLLGRSFWPRLPLFVLRDLGALASAASAGERTRAGAIARGLLAAPRRLPGFASLRAPLVAVAAARRTTAPLEAGA
jgi:GT2 family glycosyltransferase